jgi:hypothetical protein
VGIEPLAFPERPVQVRRASMSSDPSAVVSPPRADGSGERGPAVATGLSRREHEMLAFERQWWRRPGAKETAIRERFAMTPTRYYQVRNALVDRPDALVADPLLVRRLRRVRTPRRRGRTPGVLGKGPSGV